MSDVAKLDELQAIGEREGVAATTNGEDVWRGTASQIPIPDQTNGEQMTVVSTSSNDTSGGSGVREVFIHYLDGDWNPASETVTMNGTTGVDTSATDIKFVQDIHSTKAGSNGVAAGDITIHQKGDASTVYDIIATGGNMSLTIQKMVPASNRYFIERWQTTASAGNKPVFIRLRSTDHHETLYDGGSPIFIFKDTATLEAGGFHFRKWSTNYRIQVPEKSVIKISVWADQDGANVSASFQGLLQEIF